MGCVSCFSSDILAAGELLWDVVRLYWMRYGLFALSWLFAAVGQVQWLGKLLDSITAALVAACRLFYGSQRASGVLECKRPAELITLYQYEGCANCAYVRQNMSVLGLSYMTFPCPRETLRKSGSFELSRHRKEVLKLGGALQFPFMVDPNTGVKMYESADIVDYLWKTYGDKAQRPWTFPLQSNAVFRAIQGLVCTSLRPQLSCGIMRIPAKRPELPMTLWCNEVCISGKFAREALDCLEICYTAVPCPGGDGCGDSGEAGRCLLSQWTYFGLRYPYLKDPNTATEILGGSAIRDYLMARYATGSLPAETWLDWKEPFLTEDGETLKGQ